MIDPRPTASISSLAQPSAPTDDAAPGASVLAVEVRNVRKTFGAGALAFEALRDVDFAVRPGELVMLSGPSGSGKTTLLSVMGCVLRPTSGEVRLFGYPVTGVGDSELPALRAALIGFVFQGHNLIASLDAADNIAMIARLRGLSRRQARDESRQLLADVGLGELASRLPAELSGGQRQRVAIARALAGSPPLLLADEPTAALDAHAGLEVTRLLSRLSKERGTTVVVVTHDARIYPFADRIVHIEDGRIARAEGAMP
jgi:putative ABC transport system ATP-binding protein